MCLFRQAGVSEIQYLSLSGGPVIYVEFNVLESIEYNGDKHTGHTSDIQSSVL